MIAEPYHLSVTEYTLTASIGVVLFLGEDEANAKNVLDEADSAMYQAKRCWEKDCVIMKRASRF